MEETHTHKQEDGTFFLISLANGFAPEQIIEEANFQNPLSEPMTAPSLSKGLALLASQMIDMTISQIGTGRPHMPVVWCQRESFSVIAMKDGKHVFENYRSSGGKRVPSRSWVIARHFSEGEINHVISVFDWLIDRILSEGIDLSHVGKCPICSLYFVSPRSGLRRSRACSKSHQAMLAGREHRQSSHYQEGAKAQNTERMRLVREAEKLIAEWSEAGIPRKERFTRLEAWNSKIPKQLSDKVLRRIAGLDS